MPLEKPEHEAIERPLEYYVEKEERVIVRRSHKSPDGIPTFRYEAGWRVVSFTSEGRVRVTNDRKNLSKNVPRDELNSDNNPFKSPQEWINFYQKVGMPPEEYRNILIGLGVNTLDPRPITATLASLAAEKVGYLPIEGTSPIDISTLLRENLKKPKVQNQLRPPTPTPAVPARTPWQERVGVEEPLIEADFSQMLRGKDLEHNLSSQAAALGEVCRAILAQGGFNLVINEQQFLHSVQPSQGDLPFASLAAIPKTIIGPGVGILQYRSPHILFYGEVNDRGKLVERKALNDAQAVLGWMRDNPKFAPRHYISNEIALKIHQLRNFPDSPENQTLIRELLLDYARYTSDPDKAKNYVKRLKIT